MTVKVRGDDRIPRRHVYSRDSQSQHAFSGPCVRDPVRQDRGARVDVSRGVWGRYEVLQLHTANGDNSNAQRQFTETGVTL